MRLLRLWFLLFFAIAIISISASGDSKNAYSEFDFLSETEQRLKRAGYTVTRVGDRLKADHKRKPQTVVQIVGDDLVFSSFVSLQTSLSPLEILNEINSFNAKATYCRFFIDEDDLMIDAWFPASVDEKVWERFFLFWLQETYDMIVESPLFER